MVSVGLRRVAVVIALAACLAGCGGNGETDTAATSQTSASDETTTTTSETTTTTLASPLDITVVRDIRYHDDVPGMHPALLDVYSPTTPGPWPVVAAFHGGDGQFQTKLTTEVMARFLAAQGAVVFVPSIGGSDPDALVSPPEKMQTILSEVPCVEAFAAEHAAEYGGDPEDINVYGYSGGGRAAGATLWTGAMPGDGCHATVPTPQIETAVLFEGDWFVAPNWDDALDTGGLRYDEITVWDHLETDLDTEVVLVIGTAPQGSIHRIPVGGVFSDTDCGGPGDGWVPAGGTCRYFDLRDPDGTLREVMAEEGWLDDGFWDISEASWLLVNRLEDAGQSPTVAAVDGLNHGANDQQRAALVGPIIVEHALR